MAKAHYHKNQRVYVRPVGTWALIEKVMPQWAKGLDEPLRIFYDVGLGREFAAEELQAELQTAKPEHSDEGWRLVRARNKWKSTEECANHPFPGTHPQVITGDAEWGGWRVPGAEYDLYPEKVEHQARVIVSAPKLVAMAHALVECFKEQPEDLPDDLASLAMEAQSILRYVEQSAPE
jgi:hypothetical protein